MQIFKKQIGMAMKKTFTQIFPPTIIILFLTIISSHSEWAPLQVLTYDSPAAGYLRFDKPSMQNFFLVDNAGNIVYEKPTMDTYNQYIPLKNGNWAQKNQRGSECFYIYNQNQILIDSIKNPLMGEDPPCFSDWHDFIQLSNGHYLMLLETTTKMDLSEKVDGGKSEAYIVNNVIIELDHSGNIYWRWNFIDHYNVLDVTEDIDLTQPTIDLSHINSMFEDSDGNIVISVRHYDEIAKISKSTGNFIWRFGGSKCKNNEFNILQDNVDGFNGFSHQHDVTILENGNILLYDNGNLKPNPYSRAVEYSMDYANYTATKVWEGRSNPDVYQSAMGSAQRLPNGNTLVNWGKIIITEFRPNNEIAFKIKISDNPNETTYRAWKLTTKMEATNKTISTNGNYDFNSEGATNVNINIISKTGSGIANVEKHFYSPIICTLHDTLSTDILPYRWVFNYSGISSLNATMKIDISDIPNIEDFSKINVYVRGKEIDAYFFVVQSNLNAATKVISFNINGTCEVILGYSDLIAPIMTSPQNNSVLQKEDYFKWVKAIGADHYRFQLSKSANFNNIEIDTIIATTSFRNENLEFSTQYFWRLQSINSKDTSEWSENWTCFTELSAPGLILPANLTKRIPVNFTFKWQQLLSGTQFNLQISLSKNFDNIIYDVKNITTDSCEVKNLLNNTVYYWRVMAYNQNNFSDWSTPFEFRTLIQIPKPLNPSANAINININCNFQWEIVDGVTGYSIELSKIMTSGNEVRNFTSNDNNIEINKLDYYSDYSYRINAFVFGDTSDWSSPFTFSTKLKAPELTFPENQITNIGLNPTLNWKRNVENETYTVQLSKTLDFGILEEFEGIKEIKVMTTNLSPNTRYYWRVKAYLGEKESDWSSIYNFTTNSGSHIPVPKLISPKNNDISYIKGKLTWNQNKDITQYQVVISQDSDFSTIEKDTIVNNVQLYNYYKLKIGETYFWKVRSIHQMDSSAWSEIWQFKISTQSEIVKLLKPSNDDLQIELSGTCEWEPISDAIYYQLQISESMDFVNLNLNQSFIHGEKFAFNNLEKNKTYFWKVRYFRQYDTSAWSSVWTFNTLTNSVLKLPELTSPENNKTAVPLYCNFKWNKIPDASDYIIEISENCNFNELLTKSTTVNLEFDFANFKYNTRYYWRIAALNDTSKSFWSECWTFLTEFEAPVITYPSNGQINVEADLNMQWSISENIADYHLQISEDTDFNNIVYENDRISSLGKLVYLDENKTYYARIRTISEENNSQWSNIINFRTKLKNSVREIDAKLINLYPNPVRERTYLTISPVLDMNQVTISVFDLLGNKQLTKEYLIQNYNPIEINLSKLMNGEYLLVIENENYKGIIKLMKSK